MSTSGGEEGRGGWNMECFPSWVGGFFACELNGECVDALPTDDSEARVWRCKCESSERGCLVVLTRHSVRQQCIKDGDRARCFTCPMHERTPSKHAQVAYGKLCSLVAGTGMRIVCEAAVVKGLGYAFDFWVHPLHVLVEVDGERHTRDTKAGSRQRIKDRAKDAAALAADYHVLWLHHSNKQEWSWWMQAVVQAGLDMSVCARVWFSPSYFARPNLLPREVLLTM